MSTNPGQFIAPPGRRRYLRRERGDCVCFDVGTPGLNRRHAAWIAFCGMMAIMVLPLGASGLFLGITADDWEFPLRVACVVGGTIGVLGSLGPIIYAFLHAWGHRERIQIGEAGLLVRTGIPFRRRVQLTGQLAEVKLQRRAGAGMSGGRFVTGDRLRLSWPSGDVALGFGLSKADQAELASAIADALKVWRPRVTQGAQHNEWTFAALPSAAHFLVAVVKLILAPFLPPTPYLVFDVLVLTSLVVVPTALPELDILSWYTPLFGLFLIGLALKAADRGYLAGLAALNKKYAWFPVLFVSCGVAMGFAGVLGLVHTVPTPALAVVFAIPVALHVFLLKRSGRVGRERPTRGFPMDALTGIFLIPIGIAHEHLSFVALEDAQHLFILAIVIVPSIVMAVYLPVRIHYFIDAPGDRSNGIWFGLTVTAMTVWAVFGRTWS